MMETHYEFIVQEQTPIRVDKYLLTHIPEISRTYIQRVIQEKGITINQEYQKKVNIKVKQGDIIIVDLFEQEQKALDIIPEKLPLTIVYEDEDVAVIDKPAGLVVHPAKGHESGTLVHGLMYHFSSLSDNQSQRPGIVHRIDKDTSGLLIIVKNNQMHQKIAAQLQDKTLYRGYLALVHGEIKDNYFIVDAPIHRDAQDRKKMAVHAEGKHARTHVRVVQRFSGMTLVKCQLETGRTHQIRVHLSFVGYPIVGDQVYCKRKNPFNLNRQFLHAYRLGFFHPKLNKNLRIESSLPFELESILTTLNFQKGEKNK